MSKTTARILCIALVGIMTVMCFACASESTEPNGVVNNPVTMSKPIENPTPMAYGDVTNYTFTVTPSNMIYAIEDYTYAYIGDGRNGFTRVTKSNNTLYHKDVGASPYGGMEQDTTYIYYFSGSGALYRIAKSNLATNNYNLGSPPNFVNRPQYINLDTTGNYFWFVDNFDSQNNPIKIAKTNSKTPTTVTKYSVLDAGDGMSDAIILGMQQDTYKLWFYEKNLTLMPYTYDLYDFNKTTQVCTKYEMPFAWDGNMSYCEPAYMVGDENYLWFGFANVNVTYNLDFLARYTKSTGIWNYYYLRDIGSVYNIRGVAKSNDNIFMTRDNLTDNSAEIMAYNINNGNNDTQIKFLPYSEPRMIFFDSYLNALWFGMFWRNTDPYLNNFGKMDISYPVSLTIEHPTTGDEWYVGESNNIAFTLNNGTANWKTWFNYTYDDSVYYPCAGFSQPVSYATNGAKTQAWTIPNHPSATCRLNITTVCGVTFNKNNSLSELFTIASNPTVSKPAFPETGRNLQMGGTFQINYTLGAGLENYSVFANYTIDGGLNWNFVSWDNYTGTGLKCFNFTAPTLPNNTMTQFRITAFDRNMRSGTVDSNIFILSLPVGGGTYTPPNIDLTRPIGGEMWYIGNEETLFWNITDGTANYSVWANYTTDGGTNWYSTHAMITQTTAGQGTLTWTIPDEPSDDCYINITVVDDDIGIDSNTSGQFSIVSAPTVTKPLFPDTGSNLVMGEVFQINYTLANGTANYTVFANYTIDGGSGWTFINETNYTSTGLKCFNFTAPMLASNTMTQFRITVFDSNYSSGTVDSNIFILSLPLSYSRPSIDLTRPAGGETWFIGEDEDIYWNITDGTAPYYIWVNYTTDGGENWNPVATMITQVSDGQGTLTWTIPDEPSSDCFVNVDMQDDASVTDTDVSGQFTIAEPYALPVIDITRPAGGEEWTVGSGEAIFWNITDGSASYSVWANYTVDAGAHWYPAHAKITQYAEGQGTFVWTIPNAPSTHCHINMTVVDDDMGRDSDESIQFTIIYPAISIGITSPAGDEEWEIASVHTIHWTATGGVGDLLINFSYAIEFLGEFTEIATDEENDGSYSWTIPDDATDTAYLLVTAYDDNGANDSLISEMFAIVEEGGGGNPPSGEDTITITTTPPSTAVLGDTIGISAIVVIESDTTSHAISAVTIYYRYAGATYKTVSMTLASGDSTDGTWTGTIPATTVVGTIEFYIKATTNHADTETTTTHAISIQASTPATVLNISATDLAITTAVGVTALFLIWLAWTVKPAVVLIVIGAVIIIAIFFVM